MVLRYALKCELQTSVVDAVWHHVFLEKISAEMFKRGEMKSKKVKKEKGNISNH